MSIPTVTENRKMLYYDIAIYKTFKSEGIDEQHTGFGVSKTCDICHFSAFLKTECLYISFMFAMDVMIFHYVQLH